MEFMGNPFEAIIHNGYTITIEHDVDAVNPRKEYDQLGKLITWGKLQHLSDDQDIPNTYTGTEYKQKLEEDGDLTLPVYCYQHSCIKLSTAPFSCPWDSGQIGFISMSKKVVDREFNGRIDLATNCLESEVEEYSSYLNGESYGYIIKDADGVFIQSTWGFNDYNYCLTEAKSAVDTIVNKQTA